MLKLLPLTLLLLALLQPPAAHATEWGVLPLPKNALAMNPEDWAAAYNMVLAINAPLNVTLLSWKDLEPQTETYDVKNRLGGFAYAATLGMRGYFGVSLINTVKRDMPDDLAALEWTNPALLPRFEKLLNQLQTQLPADLRYFVIGNEVDVYFGKHPSEWAGYAAFYAEAKAMVQRRFPQAKVGMAVTYEGLKSGRTADISRAVAASDAAFFTFYPVLNLKAVPPAQTPAMLDELIANAQGKDVLLQEVGYPSSEKIGASPALQASFFETIIPAIAARPQIKLASIFLLHDFEPKLCNILTSYYGADQWGNLTTPFKEFICTLGVHSFDGTPKPAWDVIAKHLGGR